MWIREKTNRFRHAYQAYTREHYSDKRKSIGFYNEFLPDYNKNAMSDSVWLPKVRLTHAKINLLYKYKKKYWY